MPDYKSMYYHLAGRMAAAVDVLEYTAKILKDNCNALDELTETFKTAQQTTEEMFLNSNDNEE